LSGNATLADTYTSNWSRNLRRGHQREVRAEEWTSPAAAQLARLHQVVENVKHSFDADWRGDEDSMRRLFECFGGRLVVVRAVDANGMLLAARAAVVCGATGFDFLAATAPEGRRCYASNVALDALLSLLAARGIARYDFGGVDQTNNKGVFDFKHGAGGVPHSYVGEFEFVSPRIARGVISKLVTLRLSA
jgi:lipid II:glycine glycyltransferase (peptidoglycan interpeptide bridge formation enzyme)